MPKKIESIRAEIAKLKDEQRDIQRTGVSAAEAEAGIDDYLDRMAERYRQSGVVESLASRGVLTSLGTDDEAQRGFFFGDQIKATLMDAVADRVSDMDASQRAARLIEIKAALHDAEVAEEQIIRQSETTDQPFTRRADADPNVVLASD